MRNIILFDICGTLYKSNTTYDFLLYYFKTTNSKKLKSFKCNFTIPFRVFYKFLNILNADYFIRQKLIKYIEAEPIETVQKIAKKFVEEILINQQIAFTHNQYNKSLNTEGNKVILISASIDPIVAAIANELKTDDYFSTLLETKNDKFTGNIKEEMQGNKLEMFENIYNKDVSKITFYTDNKEDLPLALKADKVFILSSKNNKGFWTKKLKNHKNFILIDK